MKKLLKISFGQSRAPAQYFVTQIRGETILEVVVAMGILSLVMFSAFGLIGQAIATHTNVKNRVTAVDIGREGMELVRNIRDTNWIRYSGDKRNQWLCYQSPCETSAHRMTTGFYSVDPTQDPMLVKTTEQSTLNIDVLADYAEFQILNSPTAGFNHTAGEATIFYRQLELIPYVAPVCGTQPDDCPEVGLDVISRVQWLESNRKNQLTLRTRLYDFFDRESY